MDKQQKLQQFQQQSNSQEENEQQDNQDNANDAQNDKNSQQNDQNDENQENAENSNDIHNNQDNNYQEEDKYDENQMQNNNQEEGNQQQIEGEEGLNDEEIEHEFDDIVQSEETDKRSVYVKNVDYMTTKEELMEHFKDCGKINRVTICTDKYTKHPKGYAYIEFAEIDGVENSKLLTDSLLRGRQIKILPKRTNQPNQGKRVFRGGRRPRFGRGMFYGRGFYSRGNYMFNRRGRGGFIPY